MNFASELRRLRLRAKLSQAELARKIDVPRGMVCRIEQGKPVMLDTALRLLRACGAALEIRGKS